MDGQHMRYRIRNVAMLAVPSPAEFQVETGGVYQSSSCNECGFDIPRSLFRLHVECFGVAKDYVRLAREVAYLIYGLSVPTTFSGIYGPLFFLMSL